MMLTAAEEDVLLELLKDDEQKYPRGLTCTEIGESIWFDRSPKHRNRQAYARVAGKVLKRLRKLGLAIDRYTRDRRLHDLTEEGRAAARETRKSRAK